MPAKKLDREVVLRLSTNTTSELKKHVELVIIFDWEENVDLTIVKDHYNYGLQYTYRYSKGARQNCVIKFLDF